VTAPDPARLRGPLEGPGSETRLRRLNARFRAVSRRIARNPSSPAERLRLALLFLATFAATIALTALYLDRHG